MRGGGCRHGSGVLPVRGSDCWAAAGGGGHGGGATRWSLRSATPRGRLYLPGWPGRRCRSRMCRVRAIGSLRSFGWCWLVTSVLLVACSLPPWPAPRLLPSFSFSLSTTRPGRRFVRAVVRFGFTVVFWGFLAALGVRSAQGGIPVFEAAPAAQRSTHGHGDGLEAWRTHAGTRHSAGRHRPPVPVAVRGPPRVVGEGRHADAR